MGHVRRFDFLTAEDYGFTPPSPLELLTQFTVMYDATNAPYMAGLTERPKHEYRELSTEDLQARDQGVKLSSEDAARVRGNLTDTLPEDWQVIAADADDFAEAERMARLLGYLPAKAGEYLQLLWVMACWPYEKERYGWWMCCEGRQPNYAVLASISSTGRVEVNFDTHYPDITSMDGNMEARCFFVRK